MRILVLGGGGMLGHKMWQVLRESFDDVHVTLRKPKSHYSSYSLFDSPNVYGGLDVTDRAALWKTLDSVQADVICNCIGLTLRKKLPSLGEANIQLNALLPQRLAEWSEGAGARLIHYSTDCVFSGETGGYTEESVPDARDLYGRSKLLGEVESPSALVLRSSIIGRELENHTELVEWFVSQGGKTVRGFSQALYTGVTTLYMAQLTTQLIESHRELHGLYQVASPMVSKYELLKVIAEIYGMDVEIVPDDSVVVKKNLIGSKFEEATGLRVPSWPEMISAMKADGSLYTQRDRQ